MPDQPLDGAVAPDASPAATEPAPAAAPTAPQQQAAPPAQQQTAPAPTAQGDPNNPAMVPSGVLRELRARLTNEHRQAQQQWVQKEQQYQQRLAQAQASQQQLEQQRMALLGMQPPEDPQLAQARETLLQMFPGLRDLTPERMTALQKMLDGQEQSQAQMAQMADYNRQQQFQMGNQVGQQLVAAAEKDMGRQLSAEAQAILRGAMASTVQHNPRAMQAFRTNPQFAQEFWEFYKTHMLQPGAIQQGAAAIQQATAPAGPQAGQQTGQVQTQPQQRRDPNEALGAAYDKVVQGLGGIELTN